MITIAMILSFIFVVSAVALVCISKDDNSNKTPNAIDVVANKLNDTTNEFAVKHMEGYDVQSVRYVRDAQGNWTTVSVEYKRVDDKFASITDKLR
jgi:hypothetical protein